MTVHLVPKILNPFADCTAAELAEYRNWTCEICGQERGVQRHHALYRRDTRFPQLDCALNYQLVGVICHMCGAADTRANRLEFYEKQCDRYGKDVVDGWIDSLPMHDKSL